MSTPETLADTVKRAIQSGSASSSTVTTLQSLLSSSPGIESRSASTLRPATKASGASKTTRKVVPSNPASRRTKPDLEFEIHEDNARNLSPKARYALATEIVNIGLKALPQTSSGSSKSARKVLPSPDGSSTVAERTLQPRSGNATPSRQRLTRTTESGRSSPRCSLSGNTSTSAHLKSAAECARLAFSFLRSADFTKLGVRPLPEYQLENGMLSLVGRMINAGLDSLAARELRIIRRRLYQGHCAAGKQNTTTKTGGEESETLASLLRIDSDLASRPQVIPLVVTYHLNVLRILARCHKPSAIEEASQYLDPEVQGSPVQAIRLLKSSTGDITKASRQLENVASLILQLCPSVSASADRSAQDPSRSPAPVIVFRLQMQALKVRQELWTVVHHQVDIAKDLVEPFSRCMGALMRRTSGQNHTHALHETCKAAYNDLGLGSAQSDHFRSSMVFSSVRTLFALAYEAGLHDESDAWADLATKQCAGLEAGHARAVAASAMRLSNLVARTETRLDTANLIDQVNTMNESLRDKWSGSSSDFEMLLEDLVRLVRGDISSLTDENLCHSWRKLVCMSAGFASRYAKSFPEDEGCNLASLVISAAVSQSRTTEDIASWATKDTAAVLTRLGALAKVAEVAATRPLVQAWASSTAALTLSRVLKALLVKVASSQAGSRLSATIDETLIDAEHLGSVRECQLHHVLELAHKRKYQSGLRTVLSEVVRRLAEIYPVEIHPIRRARVAALALRVSEQYPELLPPHAVQVFALCPAIDPDLLGMDEGLKGYITDIDAALVVAKAFHNGCPKTEELASGLSAWRTLLAAAENTTTLEHVVDSPRDLMTQLACLEAYFNVRGDDLLRADVAQLLCDAGVRCGATTSEQYGFATMLATTHTSLGYAERAGAILESVKSQSTLQDCDALQVLGHTLCRSESLLALDQHVEGLKVLEGAQEVHCSLDQHNLRSSQSMTSSILHGKGWLLHSQFLLALGRPQESLRSAKRAAKILGGIWSKLERPSDSAQQQKAEIGSGVESVDRLAAKVSKLILNPAKTASSDPPGTSERKSAAFWPVARLLCRAFIHLTDVYVHHGIFNEANYTSEQAVKTAEAVQSEQLLCRVRYHRSCFLAAAGRLEDAELCLAQNKSDNAAMPSLANIELLRAQAALSSRNGEFENAARSMERAEDMARALQSNQISSPESKSLPSRPALAAENPPPLKTTKRPGRPTGNGKRSQATTVSKTNKRTTPMAPTAKPYVLRKLETRLQLEKAALLLKMGREDNANLAKLAEACAAYPGTFAWRKLEYDSFMHQLGIALETDFAFNALPETTLSFPALQYSAQQLTQTTVAAPKAASNTSRPAKTTKRKASTPIPFESLLSAARQCLAIEGQPMHSLTTAEIHKQYAMVSNASLLLSATSTSQMPGTLHPVKEALSLDIARIHSTQCQNAVTILEREVYPFSDLFSWPTVEPSRPLDTITAKTFQDEFIDIIPTPWTAVSMSLNEDCSELFVSRYRPGQSPLILRLPFSRQKSEDAEDDMFDYEIGKAELADIIELSNYSCHNSVETNQKGAKTNWWSEREALDLRLQELLINIENIWLGGFRGIFSQHKRDVDHLGRFRKAFDTILGRHLPSRRVPKRGSKNLTLDDQVLELFIGLGSDQDGEVDLDEPLSDLLYFVVDMLQFNGERNAYDEIDFDSMSIEVLDALRSYHDAVDQEDQEAAHLILVLDRRLHAFPWESLPCLQSSSVSRVDSMLTLRDRILEMRSSTAAEAGRHTVSKRTGSYILNPAGDLKGTESTMAPELAKLTKDSGAEWTSVVRREPSEDEFKTALSTSATLMYFGHGSGAQYIRPRAIRKLEKCSEIVWLMGCSSGAVQEYDELEPYAVPLAYMAAGGQHDLPGSTGKTQYQSQGKCMAVLATLWDVTDKDIDRFSLAVGEEWGLWGPPPKSTKLPVKTPKKRTIAAPVTPQKAGKTPKTPKVKQTPAVPRTPARSRSRQSMEVKRTRSLVEAVAESRDACYLRYLNGAAPVVYGVPVYLGE